MRTPGSRSFGYGQQLRFTNTLAQISMQVRRAVLGAFARKVIFRVNIRPRIEYSRKSREALERFDKAVYLSHGRVVGVGGYAAGPKNDENPTDFTRASMLSAALATVSLGRPCRSQRTKVFA